MSPSDFSYCVFGLHLRANHSIPGLEPERTPPKAADIEICLGFSPRLEKESSAGPEILTFASSVLLESGEPVLRVWKIANGAFLRLNYFDGMQFWLDSQGTQVWALWPDSSSLEDAATYLLGPVLGLALRLRGVTCLHASAVAFGDRAVAFVGDEGAGKSTTAAALARRGHTVLSDDIVALVERDGAFFVLPAYPYICLWPDSVNILYGPDKTLPSFSPNYDKRQLSLAENRLQFEEQPRRLGAIFLLGERVAEPAAPFLESLTPQEKLVSLVANSYASVLLNQEMRAREFALLGRLLSVVPVQRLRPSQDPARIDLLCNVVERNAPQQAREPAPQMSQLA